MKEQSSSSRLEDMRRLILFLCLLLPNTSPAEPLPIQLEKSLSPNGQYSLSILPDEETDGTGTLQILSNADKQILASFDWYQFGPHINPASAHILWKSDSQAVVLTWYQGRGWTGSVVYARTGTKWQELSLPEFKSPYPPEEGWERRGKGGYSAVAWQPKNILKATYYDETYRFDKNGQPEIADDLWIYLKFSQISDSCSLTAIRVEKQKGTDSSVEQSK